MLVKKKVYICDACGAVALQEMNLLFGVPLYHMPKGWVAFGKGHLCPICAEVYHRVVYHRVSEKMKREKEEHNI